MRLRHTPPGGEVEGHAPRPREKSVSLHAILLKLVKKQTFEAWISDTQIIIKNRVFKLFHHGALVKMTKSVIYLL